MIRRITDWLSSGRNGLLAGLGLFLILVALGWIGFLASDDVTYARGAYGWIEHFPYVGGHGTIRYPITIPMALSFLAFGENDFAMVLPSLIYMLVCLSLIWHSTRAAVGTLSANAALAVLAVSPLLVIQSSISSVDIVEMAFLFASVLLFWRCLDEGPNARLLFAAGAMAGLAFLTRETAIFIVVFYAVFFLIGHRFHRSHYLWIAAGFLFVWGLELLYLWLMTGDPLYRINISLHHDSAIDRTIDLAGNVIVNPLIDPLLVLLLNQEFMALYVIAIPAAIWLCFDKELDPRARHFSRIISLFALVWFLCASAAQRLLPLNPRYFMITTAAACTLTGIALTRLATSARPAMRLLAAASALMLVGGNLVGIYVENKDSVFGLRQLALLAATHPDETITTDPMTRYRADMLLRWEKAQARVHNVPPTRADLYFYDPTYADTSNFKMSAQALPLYQPQSDWIVIGRYAPEPTYLARALEASGLAERLPPSIWKKLRTRHPEVVLYKIP